MEQYCLSPPLVPIRSSSVLSDEGAYLCSPPVRCGSSLCSPLPQRAAGAGTGFGGSSGGGANMYWPDSWGQPPLNTSLEYELSPPAQLSARHHTQLISPVEINSPQSAALQHPMPAMGAADNNNNGMHFRSSSAATPIRVEISPSPPPVLMQSSQLPVARLRIHAPGNDALQIVTLDHKGTLQQLLCGRFWRDRYILLSGGRIQIYLTEQAYRMRQVPLQTMDLKGAEMRFFSTRTHHPPEASRSTSPQPPQPKSYGFALVQRRSRMFLLFRGSSSPTAVSPSNMTSSHSPALSISSPAAATPNGDAQVVAMNGWIQAIKDALERANPPARSPVYSQDDNLIPWFRVHTPHEALKDVIPTPTSKSEQLPASSPMHQKGCEDCGVEFVESATAFFKQFCADKRNKKSFEASGPPAAFLPQHQHKAAAPPRPKAKQKRSQGSKRTWGTEKRFLCAHCNNAFCNTCSSNRLYVSEFLRASPVATKQQLNPRLTPLSAGKPKLTQWPSQAILSPPVLGIHSPPHLRKVPPPREMHRLCTLCCRLLVSIRFLKATSATPSFFLTSPPMQQLSSESLDQGLVRERSDGSLASMATQRNSLFSPVDSIATTMSPFSAASNISPQPASNAYPGLPPLGNPIDLTAPHCCVPSSRALAQPVPESAIRSETPAGINAKDKGVNYPQPRLGLNPDLMNAPKYQVYDAIPSRSLCSSAPLPSDSPCPVKEEDIVVTVTSKNHPTTPSKPIPIPTNPAMKKQQSQRQLRNIATSLGITPVTPLEQKMQQGKVNNCPVPKHQHDPSTNKTSQKSKAGCCIM